MSTRLINSIAILDGLVLLCLSLAELGQVRQNSEQVKAAEQLSSSIVWQGFDDLAWIQLWAVSGAGAALLVVGTIGLVSKWKGASKFHAPDSRAVEATFKDGHSSSVGASVLLVAVSVVAIYLLMDLFHSPAEAPTPVGQVPNLIWKLPPLPQRVAFNLYSQMWEGVTPISVPYNPTTGPWILWESAIGDFAKSNGIEIVYFGESCVCVRNKGAKAMRKFVHSMSQNANKPIQPTPR